MEVMDTLAPELRLPRYNNRRTNHNFFSVARDGLREDVANLPSGDLIAFSRDVPLIVAGKLSTSWHQHGFYPASLGAF